jgi:hypothetical protein
MKNFENFQEFYLVFFCFSSRLFLVIEAAMKIGSLSQVGLGFFQTLELLNNKEQSFQYYHNSLVFCEKLLEAAPWISNLQRIQVADACDLWAQQMVTFSFFFCHFLIFLETTKV